MNPYGPWLTRTKATGITADDLELAIDISNTTDYPHAEASHIVLYGLKIRVEESAAAGTAQLQVGVVLENDATNGTMAIIAESDIVAASQTYESPWLDFGPEGISLRVDSGVTAYVLVPASGDLTLLKNDVNRKDATGATDQKPAVGDLVVHLDEGTDGGTYEYEVTALWRAA